MLRSLSTAFREAILRADQRIVPVSLQDFPQGSCGDACLLLAKFLTENHYRCPDYVSGTSGRYSHGWLEVGSLVVDITAGQFRDDPDAFVWVGVPEGIQDGVVVTMDRAWYKQFAQDIRHPADIELYESDTKDRLYRAYTAIAHKL